MNGLASASPQPQSLLHHSSDSPAGAALISGAGSTAISDPQSPIHDSHSSLDQNPPPPDALNIFPEELSDSDPQHLAEHTGATEREVIQTPEVIGDVQDKGEDAEAGNPHPEPLLIKEEGEVLLGHVNGQIELLEHTPEHGVGPGESSFGSDDGHDWLPDADHELKRVKVYELVGSRWIDQGTAFCFGQFSEETNEALLIARSERDYTEVILSTAIRSNDVYQRQQDTLIVWTEPNGLDYALSFQDPEGCAEVWNFIQEVRRHMNSSEDPTAVTSSPMLDASVTTASIIRSGHLPQPQLGIISEIERAIKSLARTQVVKERICEYIQQEEYIKSLINVMNTAEDLESLENLHALCSLMQTILMLNDHSMYEHILEDDIFFGVVGMLEYDPDFPGHKANYRDFLHNTAQFHQPIPMRDIAIQRKIHHTYRLQFLKDVVLARALDDSTFNVLNSCIIFNQIDIISHIQQDATFLRDVVRLFVDEDMLTGGGSNGRRTATFQPQQVQPQPHPQQQQHPSPQIPQHMIISLNGNGDNFNPKTEPPPPQMDVDQKPAATASPKPVNGLAGTVTIVNGRGGRRSTSYAFSPPDDLTEDDINLRREVVMLLQQLCIMGKTVQMPARMALFRTLVDRGILFAVQWAMGLPEKEEASKQMISAGGEVLSALLDHDINGVRAHVLKQVMAIDKEREAAKKGADKAETILQMACRTMAQSKDLAVQSQIGDALKTWLDVPMMDLHHGPSAPSEAGPKLAAMSRKDEPGQERFTDYFYKECIGGLLKPLSDLPDWRNFKEPLLPLTREETNRFVYLCDLIHNCIQQHSFRSHFHFMSSDILSRVATLFKAKDKHLRHSAFRIFRLLLKQGNHNSHVQIMKYDILKPILDLTIQESSRDNLLSCSCQEYFEHIRRENIKELIKYCMTTHEAEIQKLAKTPLGSQRFELFIRRWEMNIAPPPEEPTPDKSINNDRGWSGPGRVLDLAEEDYFNADDDDDGPLPSTTYQEHWLTRSGLIAPLLPPNNTGMKRKRRPGMTGAPKGYRPPLKTPQLTALVDYGEDDEDSTSTDATNTAPRASGSGSVSPPGSNPASPKPSIKSISPLASTSTSSGPPPKRPARDEDEDDNLEALARGTRARSQSPSPHLGPMRPSEKRRRTDDEDDEDERFAHLSKSKKPDLRSQKEGSSLTLGVKSKSGDDPPSKKIKVKFGAVGLAVASTPPSQTATTTVNDCSLPSEPGKKDGDTG
ncbi:hypothetical protein GALMADRAFT_236708 [Galerina marginata CBS 339.88]|uniref:Uncharacterized protein n=1 Tax=Galerina marginata (strain CBS 339.88) TaxID=685588 RepID=A0A067TYE7_GALM3|nr:hypothetical protein GALMADRAFT_236708 [Galerina marginata CBS 339.88]